MVKARKAKKREWLLEMYRAGLAEDRADQSSSRGGEAKSGEAKMITSGKSIEAKMEAKAIQAGGRLDARADAKEQAKGVAGGQPGFGGSSGGGSGGWERTRAEEAKAEAKAGAKGVGGDEDDAEADLEALLTWSSELDYDAYVASWHTLATSGTSGSDYYAPLPKGRDAQRAPCAARAAGAPAAAYAAASDAAFRQPSLGPGRLAAAVPEPDWVLLEAQRSAKLLGLPSH